MKKTKSKLPLAISILVVLCLIIITSIFSLAIVLNNDNKEIIDEIENSEPKNNYDFSKLQGTERKTYEDDNYVSMFGIDVSVHQDDIDWQKVKDSGVEFAFLRIGYRGATEGHLNADKKFVNNLAGAKENDLMVGVYFFSQALNIAEAVEEANYVLQQLNRQELDLPVVYDYEEPYISDATSRIHDLDKEERTNNAIAFMEEIKKNGYEVMLYANTEWLNSHYEMDRLIDYDVWFAQYDTEYPSYEGPFKIWQYSNTGNIEGIATSVDLNIMFMAKNEQYE